MNKVNNIKSYGFEFPYVIFGNVDNNVFLELKTPNSVNEANQLISIVERNKDFQNFLDISSYVNEDIAMKYFNRCYDLSKVGALGDYCIKYMGLDKVVGNIKFVNLGDDSVGVTYFLDKQYRGMGFISQALTIAETVLTSYGIKKIVLEIREDNDNSKNVAIKNNYKFKETGYCMKQYIKDLNQQTK